MPSGFDDLTDKLDEMQESANNLDGQRVSFDELFPRPFMQRHTDADDIEEFLEHSQWNIDSNKDFEAIPEIELDRYVDQHSEFRTWEQMQTKAMNEWTSRQLNL